MNENTTNYNPMDLPTLTNSTSESRRLEYTPVLISLSEQRAQEMMLSMSTRSEEIKKLAAKVLTDLKPTDLSDLIHACYTDDQLLKDSEILAGADADQLDRLLESRRSDRSKSKAKNPGKNAPECRRYIATMYAELLIRIKTGKQYTGSSSGSDYDLKELVKDSDALGKKIRALQSKKTHLSKLKDYDPNAMSEYNEVVAEIAELNKYRPNSRTTTTVTVSDVNMTELRKMLADLDMSTLSAEDQQKLSELKQKLG